LSRVEMVIDSVNVALKDYQRAVVLKEKDGERYLPMWVAADQADAILTGLSKVTPPEPLTHDFIYAIIVNLGAVLKHIIVHKLAGDTYHAKAFIERGGQIIEIDCRPSDAIATAIRSNAPIFVTEEILLKMGVAIDEKRIQNMKGKKLVTGVAASPGIVMGFVRNLSELAPELTANMRSGEIIVANPLRGRIEDINLLKMASAVVVDTGGRTCSVAIIARELRVPAVTGTDEGTKMLKTDQRIIVDGTEGAVYGCV